MEWEMTTAEQHLAVVERKLNRVHSRLAETLKIALEFWQMGDLVYRGLLEKSIEHSREAIQELEGEERAGAERVLDSLVPRG